jgi:glycerol-3-phosphate cytidylyltransferase-like family protein
MAQKKKVAPFIQLWERSLIIQNLKMVDEVISFDDSDRTANDAIYRVKQMHPQRKKIVFVNGDDRNQHHTPEMI